MKKKLINDLSTIILVIIFIAGLCLLLYPSFSDYWNSFHQSRAISNYAETVANIDGETYKKMWDEAVAYNEEIAKRPLNFKLNEEKKKEYESILDVTGTGIMAYIEIPKIKVALPIYHGTGEAVLATAIGHIEGSSFPVGGANTHCVLSGHRGLPSAKLFTDIDQLVKGDTFMIRTLDETLTYEVDQILIVLPENVSALKIEDGMDQCTLITCTPYGVNTHRLLVRGHRVDTKKQGIRATADAQQIEPVFIAPIVSVPMLLILLIWLIVATRKNKK